MFWYSHGPSGGSPPYPGDTQCCPGSPPAPGVRDRCPPDRGRNEDQSPSASGNTEVRISRKQPVANSTGTGPRTSRSARVNSPASGGRCRPGVPAGRRADNARKSFFRQKLLGTVLVQDPGRQYGDFRMGIHIGGHPAEKGRIKGDIRIHNQMIPALQIGQNRIVGPPKPMFPYWGRTVTPGKVHWSLSAVISSGELSQR